MATEGEGRNPLWEFSLRLYAQPGVAEACLSLQDRRGIDVNVLLLLVWAGWHGGVTLTSERLARIDASIAAWRTEVVQPLRAVRRYAKGKHPALYDRLKLAELTAERFEQDELYRISAIEPGGGGSLTAVRRNLALLMDEATATDEAAFGRILDALQRATTGTP